MKVQKIKFIKYSALSITLLALIFFPATKANAGFFSDGLKNALQFVKSIIISPDNDNKSDGPEPNDKPSESKPAANAGYVPQPPTPWSDLSNIINLIKKEQERLKNEFMPQKFLDRQKIIKLDVLTRLDSTKMVDAFLNLDLTTEATSTFFNINSEELQEWQMRQKIIGLLNEEINWYDQKSTEGLKMTNRKKVDNLIILIKNHRKEFKKINIEPARIAILINGADEAFKVAQNRNIIIKNSISNIKIESDRQIAEKLFSASQDKINLASIKIHNIKNNSDLTLEIAEPIILEINSLIKSIYEDFQLISEML